VNEKIHGVRSPQFHHLQNIRTENACVCFTRIIAFMCFPGLHRLCSMRMEGHVFHTFFTLLMIDARQGRLHKSEGDKDDPLLKYGNGGTRKLTHLSVTGVVERVRTLVRTILKRKRKHRVDLNCCLGERINCYTWVVLSKVKRKN